MLVWPAIISSVSALLGVPMGGFLTGRVQKRQWARGQQIEACAAIVVESTRVQLALRACAPPMSGARSAADRALRTASAASATDAWSCREECI